MSSRLHLLFAIASLSVIDAIAQLNGNVVLPPSPNPAALARIATIPINNYTGVTGVSVPIYSIPTAGTQIPVSLEYHGSGIKVQDIAGSVGLGWSLNAGGAITRMVRGRPDGSDNPCVGSTALYNSYFRSCDSEADIFMYSFLGRGGKMYLTDTGDPATMPYADLVITPGAGPQSTDGSWKIIDENGYTYFFGENQLSREETVDPHAYVTGTTYISTWYLTRVVSPYGVNVALFSYLSGPDFSPTYYAWKQLLAAPGACVAGNSPSEENFVVTTKALKYLSAIQTTVCTASFGYNPSKRKDHEELKELATITISDGQGPQKKYFLHYSYFNDPIDVLIKRALMLDRITEGSFYADVNFRKFEYWTTSKPDRGSIYEDHWGYYNYSSGNPVYYSKIPYGISIDCNMQACVYSNKSSNEESMKNAALKSITYPTGGLTEFIYEMKGAGGLRIKKIETRDGTTLIDRREFTYGGELIHRYPRYFHSIQCNGTILQVSSTAFNDIFDLDGIAVGYSTVTETMYDGSKVTYEFTDYSMFPDVQPQVIRYSWLGSSPGNYPATNGSGYANGPPFAPFTPFYWMRGLPLRTKVYDNFGNLLTLEDYYPNGFIYSPISGKDRTCYSVHLIDEDGDLFTFYKGTYTLRSHAVLAQTMVRYTYAPGQGAQPTVGTVETISNMYHSTHRTKVVQSKRAIGANGPFVRINYKYASDIATAANPPAGVSAEAEGLWCLKKSNVLIPVETTTFYGDRQMEPGGAWTVPNLTSGSILSFKKRSISPSELRPVPYRVYALKIPTVATSVAPTLSTTPDGITMLMDPNYRVSSEFNVNHGTGEIQSSNRIDGIVYSYEWESAGTVLRASSTNSYRTEYQSRPMVGIVQQTDPNGQKSFYDYNSKGNLKLIKDNDGNILNRFRYHHKSESENQADFGFQMNGCQATFVLTSTIEPGSRLVWDFGNGTVKENGNSTELVNYSGGNNYTVKLAVVHPEFPTRTASKTLNLLAPPSIAITSPSLPPNPTICPSTNPELNLTLTATPPAGGPFTYTWEYIGSGNWLTFGVGSSNEKVVSNTILFSPGTTKVFRCKITDSQDGISCYSNPVTVFLSCQSGGAGGQENCVNPGCYWNGTNCVCNTSCQEGYFWDGFQCVAY
jgi:YD repeat-containing protein